MKIPNNNGRLWIPKKYLKELGIDEEDFVLLNITNIKNNKELEIISKISDKRDKRITIPKSQRDELGLHNSNKVSVSIHKLHNTKRTKLMFLNDKLDLLSFIPTHTLKNYEILVLRLFRKNEEYLRNWYYSEKSRPKEVILRRFLDIELARFLGYLQAEGNKKPKKILKRRGLEVSFTNKSFYIIEDFLRLSKILGIEIDNWGLQITHRFDMSKSKIQRKKDFISERFDIPIKNITLRSSDRVRTFTFRFCITKTLFFEIINKMMNDVRKYIVENSKNNELSKYFVQGLLAGDGSFNYHRDKSLHTRLSLFETNKKFINDYARILQKYGFKGRILKSKNKNLYTLNIATNWENLITIFKNEFFIKSEINQRKLLKSLKIHKKTETHSYLKLIQNGKNIEELKKSFGFSESRVRDWIKYRLRDGFLVRKKEKYHLTNTGKEIIEILDKLEKSSC